MPHISGSAVLAIAIAFALAGIVKGITGMGLPTVAIALLGLFMSPVQAAALLVIPSFATNVWQFAVGLHRLQLFRRIWPMLATISVTTWASSGLLARGNTGYASVALGIILAIYAVLCLAKTHWSIPERHEIWLSPAIGAITGIVTGATGVFAVPAVPYLQALPFDKEDLVQALGLSFTASTVALAGGLASHGALHIAAVSASSSCVLPAILGMFFGQWIRIRIDPSVFRFLFFFGILCISADLVFRTTK
jgi:uncharacterized protein